MHARTRSKNRNVQKAERNTVLVFSKYHISTCCIPEYVHKGVRKKKKKKKKKNGLHLVSLLYSAYGAFWRFHPCVNLQVCLDMKSALVCLRTLGISVRGPLEDPAVARWLVEPPVDDKVLDDARKTNSTAAKRKRGSVRLPPAAALPRASVTSLSLSR